MQDTTGARQAEGAGVQGNTGKGKDRGAVALQQAYLRVVGLEEDLQGSHNLPTFT